MLRTVAVCATVILLVMKFLNIDPIPTWLQVFTPIGIYVLLVIAIHLLVVTPVLITALITEVKFKRAKKKYEQCKKNKAN